MVGAKSSEGFLVAKIRRQEITEYRLSLRVHAARGTYCHAKRNVSVQVENLYKTFISYYFYTCLCWIIAHTHVYTVTCNRIHQCMIILKVNHTNQINCKIIMTEMVLVSSCTYSITQ